MWITSDKYRNIELWDIKPHRKADCPKVWVTDESEQALCGLEDFLCPKVKWEDNPLEVAIVAKNIDTDKRDKWIEETVEKVRKSVESRYKDCHYKDNYLDEVRDALRAGYDKAVSDIFQ